MEENKIFTLNDINLNEEERSIVMETISLFAPPSLEKELKKENYPLTKTSNVLKEALEHKEVDKERKRRLKYILGVLHIKLRKWEVSKKSNNILGEINHSEFGKTDTSLYYVIEASNINEAKIIRDEIESESFDKKAIHIKDLISIINNMERAHGSSTIHPNLLKELLKEKLKW